VHKRTTDFRPPPVMLGEGLPAVDVQPLVGQLVGRPVVEIHSAELHVVERRLAVASAVASVVAFVAASVALALAVEPVASVVLAVGHVAPVATVVRAVEPVASVVLVVEPVAPVASGVVGTGNSERTSVRLGQTAEDCATGAERAAAPVVGTQPSVLGKTGEPGAEPLSP